MDTTTTREVPVWTTERMRSAAREMQAAMIEARAHGSTAYSVNVTTHRIAVQGDAEIPRSTADWITADEAGETRWASVTADGIEYIGVMRARLPARGDVELP